MSTGHCIYKSVRLFCVTIFLIGLMLEIMPTLSQLWVFYAVKKVEREQAASASGGPLQPEFRATAPQLREEKL